MQRRDNSHLRHVQHIRQRGAEIARDDVYMFTFFKLQESHTYGAKIEIKGTSRPQDLLLQQNHNSVRFS